MSHWPSLCPGCARMGDPFGHVSGGACRPEPTGAQNVGVGAAEGTLQPRSPLASSSGQSAMRHILLGLLPPSVLVGL